MSAVNNITVGNKVEISLLREEKIVDKTYISVVEDVFENNQILMYVPISYGSLIRLEMGKVYSMLFITAKGMYKFEASVIKYINEGAFNFMLVELLTDGEKVQRREFFRFRCSIPFKFEKFTDEENEESYNDDKDLILSYGIIEDIGGGGIRFVSNEELEEGDKIKCLVVLGDNYVICVGKILIKENSINNVYKNQYRIEFINMKTTDKDIIVKYIFNEQRKVARKSNFFE